MATRAWEDILPHLNVLGKGRAAATALKDILDKVEDFGEIAKTAAGITPKFCDGDIEVREVRRLCAYVILSSSQFPGLFRLPIAAGLYRSS